MPTPKKHGPESHWTTQEIEALKKMSLVYTSPEIATLLKRSKGAIQSQSYRTRIHLLNKDTSTSSGRLSERHAQMLLPNSRLLTNEYYHAPYDLEWNGKRINVKSATLRYTKSAGSFYWTFRTKKSWENCDLFFFLGYIKGTALPVKAWLIPSELCQRSSIGMSHNYKRGMYVKYEIEVNFLENIING